MAEIIDDEVQIWEELQKQLKEAEKKGDDDEARRLRGLITKVDRTFFGD